MGQLDTIFRVTEKEEMEKAKRLGKSSKQFYEEKEMAAQYKEQKKNEGIDTEVSKVDKMKSMLKSSELNITEKSGDGFTALEVSHKADSPDPRVGGTRITFDSRLDKISEATETSELDAFRKIKAEQKQRKPVTELERSTEMVQQLLEEQA